MSLREVRTSDVLAWRGEPPHVPAMDATALRLFVYDRLLDHAEMPTTAAIAAHLRLDDDAARALVRGAGLGKTLVADARGEPWMAGPFAAGPTPYRVRARGRAWWANCAWDMLGVAHLVGAPAELEARCTDCGDPMPMRVADADAPVEGEGAADAVVHFLVPARRWYDDIGFT